MPPQAPRSEPRPGRDPFAGNPLLRGADTGRDGTRPARIAASVAIHLAVVALVLVLPAHFVKPEPPRPVEITFYRQDTVPVVPPEPDIPEPEPRPEPVEVAEIPPEPEPEPPPRPEPVARPVEPPRPEVARVEPPPPRPEPAPAPKRTVQTDTFRDATAAVRPEAPARREAKAAGFGAADTAPATHEVPERAVVASAGFVADPGPAPRGHESPRVVASGGFGGASAVAVPRKGSPGPRQAVGAAGFGSGATAPAVPPARTGGTVRAGGFGDITVAAARPTSNARRAVDRPLDTPVEIVSKPTPAYTERARELRIEGEVVLEVTFVANGDLRVLRVVDGLGYGLDESAVAAAENIRFKPARRDGKPVDHTATLRVVFRLA